VKERIQPPYGLIHTRLEQGKVIPFLGSGASLGERDPRAQPWNPADPCFPSARELADYLAKPVRFPADGETRELTKVARYYELMAGRDVLDEDLHTIFTRKAQCAKVHAYLASLPTPLLIITTNYDDLVEQALEAQRKAYDVVIHLTPATLKRVTDHERIDSVLWRPYHSAPRFVTDDELAEIDLAHTFVIYKMHGGIDREQIARDSYVITEDDYIDFLTRMTSRSASAIPAFVARHLEKRHLLFLGYSLRDWNLRVLLNQIDPSGRRSITSWAVQYQPSRLEEQFWKRRSEEVLVFDMRVDEFVEGLQKP
jgi:SIR2-like domain